MKIYLILFALPVYRIWFYLHRPASKSDYLRALEIHLVPYENTRLSSVLVLLIVRYITALVSLLKGNKNI